MAATVRLLRRQVPGEEIVLMIHNGHLQRVPLSPIPGMTSPTAGTHLAAELGDRYFALALTAVSGTTTGLAADPAFPLGFRMFEQALGEPVFGSVEAALASQVPCVVAHPAASSIRHAHTTVSVDVASAFDAVVCLEKQETIFRTAAE